MKIYFKKSFIKQYQKLPKSARAKIDHTLEIFEKNPHDPKLYNHPLTGKLAGKRSIAAGFDLRIIFEVEGNYVVVIIRFIDW